MCDTSVAKLITHHILVAAVELKLLSREVDLMKGSANNGVITPPRANEKFRNCM